MKKEDYIAAMQKINISDQFMKETITLLESDKDQINHKSKLNQKSNQRSIKSNHIWKAAAIIVVMLLSTAGITAAAAKLNITDVFQGYFKEPSKQESNINGNSQNDQNTVALTSVPMREDNEFITKASALVSSSVTKNGLKLTARGIVGDKHTIYMAVNVETVDKSPFSKSQKNAVKGLSFSKVWLQTNGNALGQYCYVTRVDDESNAGKATFVLRNSLDIKGDIKHINITFTNMTAQNEGLIDIGSQKSLLDMMNEIGEASEDDFDFMGMRSTNKEDYDWFNKLSKKFLNEFKKDNNLSDKEISGLPYDSYWGKRDAYMEKAIMEREGILPKYCIKKTKNQANFCTKYPKLAISNIGIRNNQLCVKFELNNAMSFENFRDSRIVLVNKKNGSILVGSVDASQPINGNDESQADMVNGKIISCGAQFNGISNKDVLKDYNFAFGGKDFSETTLYEGEWKLDFDVDYKDTSREYSLSENVKINGEERKLEKISVSPLSLQLQLGTQQDAKGAYEQEAASLDKNINIVNDDKIKIIMKNNKEIIMDNLSYDDNLLSTVLPVVIDLNQISSININGTKIELSN